MKNTLITREHRIAHEIYYGKKIVVKVPTKEGLQSHRREKAILDMVSHPNVVKPFGLVMERLNTAWPIEGLEPKRIVKTLIETLYDLSLENIYWTPRLEHMGVDKDGVLKIFDFNDMTPEMNHFEDFKFTDYFGRHERLFNLLNLFKFIYKIYNVPYEGYDIGDLLIKLYQKLFDVHQPIPVDALKDTPRTETEPNSPNCGKLLPAGRKCEDRLLMIQDLCRGRKVLDVGCNIGWFGIKLPYREYLGIDQDIEKIRFANLVAWQEESSARYMARPLTEYSVFYQYDVILAMSMLHLVKTNNLQECVSALWNNAGCLVMELPVSFLRETAILQWINGDIRELGVSDNGRTLYCFTKKTENIVEEMQKRWDTKGADQCL